MARIAVAMSGGVDSLRAASLLQEIGHDVVGLHLRLLPASPTGRWSADELLRAQEESVHSLASRLNIALTVIDGRDAFEGKVIQPFLEAYRNGLTPNPCVCCNPEVKFRLLLEEALKLGAQGMATGHYARIVPPNRSSSRYGLLRGLDLQKDQSYFLFGLSQQQLSRTTFPLGDHSKNEVLLWARWAGFHEDIPEESQEICFIPNGHYRDFLQDRMRMPLEASRGPIVDAEGNILGEHKGLFAYTIGQRRGLGIASTTPYYVIELDVLHNTVRVGRPHQLECTGMTVSGVNWVSMEPPGDALSCSVKIRHQHRPAKGRIIPMTAGKVRIQFDNPQRAVTPGQAAVFYDGDLLLGGGIIQKTDT
jgi:tRNA-specific 2-thiouridylase